MKHSGTILLNPRITEKGAFLAEMGCYVFNVSPAATKTDIMAAIHKTFKVTPRKVAVARVPRKEVTTRGTNRRGMSVGGKKAYVYLKKGDKIDLA